MRFFLYIFCSFFLLVAAPTAAQNHPVDEENLSWSATRRLTASDFWMKLRENTNMRGASVVSGFGMHGRVHDLLGKQGKYVVRNTILRSASWLDTTASTADIQQTIQYHQTVFDIQEIYARQLRRELKANATRILLFGKPDLEEINNQYIKAAQQRQVAYTEATAYGTISKEQLVWEKQIQRELQELQAFEFGR